MGSSIVRAVDCRIRNRLNAVDQIPSHFLEVESVFLKVFDGYFHSLAQTHNSGHILCSGTNSSFLTASIHEGANGCAPLNVEEAHSLWSADLMSTKCYHITT